MSKQMSEEMIKQITSKLDILANLLQGNNLVADVSYVGVPTPLLVDVANMIVDVRKLSANVDDYSVFYKSDIEERIKESDDYFESIRDRTIQDFVKTWTRRSAKA